MPKSPNWPYLTRPRSVVTLPPAAPPAESSQKPDDPSGFTSKPQPAAPDTAQRKAGDGLTARAALVQVLLKTLSDARFGVQDFDVYLKSAEQLVAIGPYTQPLISGFQKPSYLRKGNEAEFAVPNSQWTLAPWSDQLLQRFLTDAQMGLDDDHRKRAMDSLQTLLTTLKTSHPQVVSKYFPQLRELALKGRKEVWPNAVKMLADFNDREWANTPMTLILESRNPRAAEIMAHSNHEQTIRLLQHVSADVRQLMARFASPEDLKKALEESASDADVRRSIIQGVGKISITRGVTYAEHCNMLLQLLKDDPSPLVTAEAGRSLTHLDTRIVMGVVVRNVQFLRYTDPIKVTRAAQELLRLDADETLRAFVRSVVELVANDEKTSQEIRAALARVLLPAPKSILHPISKPVPLPVPPSLPPQTPIAPAVPARIVADIVAPKMQETSAPALSEWATRATEWIESGKFLALLQGKNIRQIFIAVHAIQRAWGELSHLRAAQLSAKLLSVASELPAENSLYEPMRGAMAAWALRLDPQPVSRHFMQLLSRDLPSEEDMKIAAAYALSVTSPDVIDAQEGRKFVTDLLLASLRDSRPLKRFESRAMNYLPGFSDLVAPRLTEMIRWVQRKGNHSRIFSIGILKKLVIQGGEPFQKELQVAIVPTTLDVNDLDILQVLGDAGVSRISELIENPKLSAEDRRSVLNVLINMGDVARPSLAALATSEFSAHYFDALHADGGSPLSQNALLLMVEFLRHSELRPRAEGYLREHAWDAVPPLNEVLKTTSDVAHQRAIQELLLAIGNGILVRLVAGKLPKDEAQRRATSMEILLPLMRNSVLQEAARNPNAFIAWAEQLGREGEFLLELMSRHADQRVQKLAMKALTKRGEAFLEWGNTPAGRDARVKETPEAAFRLLEGVRK